MLTIPSFFALIVQPSTQAKMSRAMSIGGLPSWPGSRVRMNQAFSANRQASRKNGTPCRWQTSRVARMFSRLTGWPPPELFVTVVMTSGTFPGLSASTRSSLSMSMLPLKGWRNSGSSPSAIGKSSAMPPRYSTLARVVSKWVLFGTMSPGFTIVPNRIRSAARPWCVGRM